MSLPSAKNNANACACRGMRRRNRGGPRHWFRITGLPGSERARLGLPAFGDPDCIPRPRPGFFRRLIIAMRQRLGRKQTASMELPGPSTQ